MPFPDDSPSPKQSAAGSPGKECIVAGIGASAGGLEAVTELLRHIPRGTGMAYVVILHLDPTQPSAVAALLSSRTELTAAEATDGLEVSPDHIYVIPPNALMTIRDGRLILTQRLLGRASHLPIDQFFCSLAEDTKERSIGVVLSGTGRDGTIGLEAIKSEGGLTLAQDKSAAYNGMPREAAAAGVVDMVLSPDRMAAELISLSGHVRTQAGRTEILFGDRPSLEAILHLLRDHCGVDFTHYKSSTIQRRLARRLALNRIDTLEEYLKFVRGDERELNDLFNDLLITVTEFFRDPDTFQALSENVLPALLRNRNPADPIRVWVVGCSTGKEAYSLAIAITEAVEQTGLPHQVQVFGTDVSTRAIEAARTGKFPESLASSVSMERLRRPRPR